MAKHDGDHGKAVELLLTENREYRAKNAKLKAALDEAKGKAAPDGAAVLTPDESKAWAAYQALGPAADIATALEAAKGLTAKLAASERRDLLAKAAEAHGFKPSVLTRLMSADATVEIKESEKDGKPVKVAWVREGDEVRDLDAYAAANWPEFMPALRAEAQAGTQAGTQFVKQSSGGKAPKPDMVEAFIERQQKAAAARANPLIPKTVNTGA